ncbi:hypothetical protein J4Q44_G00351420 [Coregonus suidteri]|uniref:Uncharacterized protein n=1 Tax=Coregonus suidteri TaxID=861788 RepID=A0AAN8KMX4_9TELE
MKEARVSKRLSVFYWRSLLLGNIVSLNTISQKALCQGKAGRAFSRMQLREVSQQECVAQALWTVVCVSVCYRNTSSECMSVCNQLPPAVCGIGCEVNRKTEG